MEAKKFKCQKCGLEITKDKRTRCEQCGSATSRVKIPTRAEPDEPDRIEVWICFNCGWGFVAGFS